MHKHLSVVRYWLREFFCNYDEIIRLFAMAVLLTPAAYYLPRRAALAAAYLLALLLLISPQSGRRAYIEMRCAFGMSRLKTAILTWKWLSRPFRDFIVSKRIWKKREDLTQWKIIEKNPEAVCALRQSGQSYIVASGHFAREAIAGMFSPEVTRGHPIQVAQCLPDTVPSLHDLRTRFQLRTLLQNRFCWGRETEVIFTGDSSFIKLVSRLREPGNAVFIHIDAPWSGNERSSYTRPFIGYQSKAFALGAVRLARQVKCPIVSCVYRVENERTIVLEYGTPIFPSPEDGKNAEVQMMDQLLNHLETAVGEHPDQYVLSIGCGRRWNPAAKRWEDLPA